MTPALVFAAAALVAWLNRPEPQSPPPPKPAPDRVVLLPDPDGRTGAVLLQSASGSAQPRVVDRAYDTAEVARDGGVSVLAGDARSIQARYGELLSARPRPPESFTVYFRAGSSSELTPQSAAIIEQLKAELGRRAVPEVQVIGHTDRVGKLEANDELSRRRAETVRDLLVAAGIARGQIETSGRGEREPLVPTADEVAEPKNRRVEITVR